MTDTNPSTRKCGDCRVCCTVMGVVEIEKPMYTRCSHVCSRGCRIYEDRPETCRIWSCIWAQGGFPKHWRPDKVGIVFSYLPAPHDAVMARPSKPGTTPWMEPDIRETLLALSAKGTSVLCGSGQVECVFLKGVVHTLTPADRAKLERGESVVIVPGEIEVGPAVDRLEDVPK